jgi:Fe2+ or Zn2+ uptake regulation protein
MISMMGKAHMAEAAISKLDSVLAGLRGYLTEQLRELDGELEAARKSVVQLGAELAAAQSAVEVLAASRDLLVSKLNELDGVAQPAAEQPAAEQPAVRVPAARRPRTEKAPKPEKKAAAAESQPKSEPKPEPQAASKPESNSESESDSKAESKAVSESASGPKAPKALNAGQQQVLAFLETTPGVHKVAEIAADVSGPDASAAAVQAVRRALSGLTAAGLVAKSEQSGTAFYSATSAVVVEAVEVLAAEVTTRKPVVRKAVAKKAPAGKAAPAKSAPAKSSATKSSVAKSSTKSAAKKPATAKPRKAAATKAVSTEALSAEAAGAKQLRADRTKIVATLLAAQEPQSAGDVSRTVMGAEWKSSDATNFRSVLKSLVSEGVVTEHVGENNRARYTVAATS